MIRISKSKVGQLGGSLYVIIPKFHAEDIGIVKGDEVELYRDDDDRIIIVQIKKETRCLTTE